MEFGRSTDVLVESIISFNFLSGLLCIYLLALAAISYYPDVRITFRV